MGPWKSSDPSTYRRIACQRQLAHKFVARAMHSPEVERLCRVFFQLLPELQNMIVNGPGRRIALISPDLVNSSSRETTRSWFCTKNFSTLNSCAVRVTGLLAWVNSMR